jgi:hypothetical protein
MRKPWPALGRSATGGGGGGGDLPRTPDFWASRRGCRIYSCLHLDYCTDRQSAKSCMGGLGFHSLSLQKENYYYYYCLLFNLLAAMNSLLYVNIRLAPHSEQVASRLLKQVGKFFQGNYRLWL